MEASQQQQQQQEEQQPPQVLHHREQQQQRGTQRGLLKLALEGFPLQQAQIPPCRLRSVAIVNSGDLDDRLLIYLGTDSGHLLLFTWYRSSSVSPSPSRSSSPVSDPSVAQAGVSDSSKSTFLLTGNRVLGKAPIDCLCPLPLGGRIAALSDQQVVILDLHTLGPLEWLPLTKGASALARAFGSPVSLQNKKESVPNFNGVTGREIVAFRELPKRSGGQGQLGRLFGSGRVSGKRGGWGLLIGELGATSQPGGSSQGNLDGMGDIYTTRGASPGSHWKALDTNFNGIERFVVAVKQKLLLYEVRNEGRRRKDNLLGVQRSSNLAGDSHAGPVAVKVKEIPGPEEVVTMAWFGNVIITGNHQQYMLFSVTDGQASLLFSLPQDLLSPPLLKLFPKELEVLILMDTVGVVVNAAGQPTSGSLVFKDVPDAVGQSSSYVVAVKQGLVELYHRKTGAKMQSVILSDTEMGPYFITDDDDGKFIVVATALKVYCLERVPLDQQLKELLRHRQFNEAVELAEECAAEAEEESAKERLAIVHAQAGFLLFFDLRFKDAVDHFLQSSVMHPSEIFPFFPHLTHRWRALIPRNRYWGLHPPPQAIQTVIESRLQAIQRGLMLQSASNMNDLKNRHSLLAASGRSRSALVEEYALQAIEQVIRYLKVEHAKSLTPSLKEGVDTLLMKLFIELGATGEMEQLAASENSCLVGEVEDTLQVSGQLRTLAFLYESKGMQTQALQVWQTLAQGSMTLPMLETVPARVRAENTSKKRVEISAFQTAAATEASRLLEASSDSDVVLQHLEWILKVSQDLALQILTSAKRSKALPPDDVLGALGPNEAYVQQRYLQWLVQDQGVEDAGYHTLFAVSLAKSAMEIPATAVVETKGSEQNTLADDPSIKSRIVADTSIGTKMTLKTKHGMHDGYLTSSMAEEGDLRGSGTPSDRQGEASSSGDSTHEQCNVCENIRHRLQAFLESSEKYDANSVLDLIDGSELWREQAILYRKLGDEVSVFRILALKLEDTEAAERYCTELGRPDAYMRLLDMYLKPGEGMEPMYYAAVHLLQLHGTSLDPLQVLEALSPDMPLQLAFQTITRMFRTRVHLHREGQIIRHLSRAENFEARVARLEERSRHARITDSSTCGSCLARFGTKLFALYPNDSVVCYKCFRRFGEHIDPVTGHDFQKDPIHKPSHWLKDTAS